MSEQSYLLPNTVQPVHYEVVLNIDLEELSFSGEETVNIKVKVACFNHVSAL